LFLTFFVNLYVNRYFTSLFFDEFQNFVFLLFKVVVFLAQLFCDGLVNEVVAGSRTHSAAHVEHKLALGDLVLVCLKCVSVQLVLLQARVLADPPLGVVQQLLRVQLAHQTLQFALLVDWHSGHPQRQQRLSGHTLFLRTLHIRMQASFVQDRVKNVFLYGTVA